MSLTEADTCRKFVVPQLQAAGWDNEPHSIAEQRTITDLMMRLEFRTGSADPRFVWYWLQSPSAREFVSQNAKGTSPTMKKISQGTVMAIPFPASLPLADQRRIVAQLDEVQAQADSLKRLQSETSAELDALLPSILDRAFRGEL